MAGGDLNDAWRLELDDGTPAFAKTGHPGTYEPEAAGLAWLADGGATVPEVLAASDDVLVLSWVEEARHDPEDLGRMVATMHRAGAASSACWRTAAAHRCAWALWRSPPTPRPTGPASTPHRG